jgi:hypothetical protein
MKAQVVSPEFVNQVINHINNLRKEGRCPYNSRVCGMDVVVNMAHLAIVNIGLLHDMNQIKVSCFDDKVYVTLRDDVRMYYINMSPITQKMSFDDESYDQFLHAYIHYVAYCCQKGLNSVHTIQWFYEQQVVSADLPF